MNNPERTVGGVSKEAPLLYPPTDSPPGSSGQRSATERLTEGIPGLWGHQTEALSASIGRPGFMLAMEMATGKTRVAIEWAKLGTRILVVCPSKVVPVWPSEFAKYAPEMKVHVLHGSARDQALQVCITTGPVVFVTNYEIVWREPLRTVLLNKADLDSVILDESHRIKTPSSKVSLWAATMGKRVKRRLCLTGTPAPNTRLDLYGQFRFLDPAIFGTNYRTFSSRYAVFGGFENRQLLFYRNDTAEEMRVKWESVSYRVRLDDVLDLPPYVDASHTFVLGQKAKRVYDELEKESLAEITPTSLVVSGNILTKLLRLQQVTSGFVPDTKGVIHQVDNGKISLLGDILSDLPRNEPVVVFCVFHHDLDLIREMATSTGRNYGELSGRRDDVKGAVFPDGVDILGVQIQSGKEGVDFSRAKYAVFYSLGYSLSDYDQASARLRRPGQTRPVARIHLLAEKTVDERIARALVNKRSLIQALIDPD